MRTERPGRRVLLAVFVLFACFAAGACSGDALEEQETDTPEPCSGRAEGDLVITEFLADPQGTDAGKEYFELFNATEESIDLQGLTLSIGDSEGARLKTHVVTQGRIAAGGYFVVGDARAETLPAHLDYSYGQTLGALANGGGRIEVRCGDTVVDAVRYAGPVRVGRARILGGGEAPDASGNDSDGRWCDAPTELSAGTYGSPGEANGPCALPQSSDTCRDSDSGQLRPVVPPRTGELVVTEILANPAGSDSEAKHEWIELFAREDVDLNGVTVASGSSSTILRSESCLRLERGAHAVLAQSLDPNRNGGLPAPKGLFSFALANGANGVRLSLDETELDAAQFADTIEGAAFQLPGLPDAGANDDPAAFCLATTTYGSSANRGSPGAPNASCPPVVPPGYCLEDGLVREVRPPSAGDLVVTELMANAAGTESETEWFEVYVKAGDVDLNGLEASLVGGASPWRLDAEECIEAAAGTYLLFARTLDPSRNGALPSPFARFAFGLTNGGGTLRLAYEGRSLDELTYPSQTEDGVALQLAGPPDAEANDEPSARCPAPGTYGAGTSRGSPGVPNGPCAEPATGAFCLENGEPRPIRPPSCGDLVLSELMVNAPGIESETEWFELYVRGDGFDLNGLKLSTHEGSGAELLWEECLSPETGRYLLFARTADPSRNGGLPPPYATYAFDLPNTGGALRLDFGASCLNEVSYPSQQQDGLSRQLSHPFVLAGVPDARAFCPASWPYGYGWGWGTPGAANGTCGW